MKKIVAIIMLLATVSGGFSQTKEETQNWIKEKLLKHTTEDFSTYRSVAFTYDGYIEMRFIHEIPREQRPLNPYLIKTWRFPVWAIGTVAIENGYKLNRSGSRYKGIVLDFNIDRYTEDYCSFRYSKGRMVPNESTSRADQYQNYIKENKTLFSSRSEMVLPFKYDPEHDFTNRFNKAIQHLKTFYPKPVVNEKF